MNLTARQFCACVVLAVSGSSAAQAGPVIRPSTPQGVSGEPSRASQVTCEVVDDPEGRTYRLTRPDSNGLSEWELQLSSAAEDPPGIRLILAGARPIITADRAELRYRSATGGIIIDLTVDGDTSSLDVYVSYELEVNVEPDLSPAVDELNSHGVLADLRCRLETEE